MEKQVKKSHYGFASYMSKARWSSIWHQVDEVMKLKPNTVLEVGPGLGTFKAISKAYGLEVKTFDIDPELNPDYVGSVTAMPIPDNYCQVVCAFQILEHLHYEETLIAFSELIRVSERYVVISLPDVRTALSIGLGLLGIYETSFVIDSPFYFKKKHIFDGEHYWEINKKGYELKKVVKDFQSMAKLVKTYRNKTNPYHRYFVFEK